MDGRGRQKISPPVFPHLVFGRFTYTLSALCEHYLGVFWGMGCFGVMFAHIRQCVREQPDTWISEMPEGLFSACP